jgi:hypothetical protein
MATEGHCDLVARVDVVVPVGPLEALPVEGPRLLAEPTCDLYTKRHEHRAFARGEVPMVVEVLKGSVLFRYSTYR